MSARREGDEGEGGEIKPVVCARERRKIPTVSREPQPANVAPPLLFVPLLLSFFFRLFLTGGGDKEVDSRPDVNTAVRLNEPLGRSLRHGPALVSQRMRDDGSSDGSARELNKSSPKKNERGRGWFRGSRPSNRNSSLFGIAFLPPRRGPALGMWAWPPSRRLGTWSIHDGHGSLPQEEQGQEKEKKGRGKRCATPHIFKPLYRSIKRKLPIRRKK